MVFALLVVIAGAFVLAGWAQLLSTRARFADSADDAQERRITLDNSRAMVRQHILTYLPSGSIPPTNIIIATRWGNRTNSVDQRSGLWDTTNKIPSTNSANNPFSPMERFGFFITIDAMLTDGTNSYLWTFCARSRSPVAAGFGYVLHNTNATYTATNLPSNYIDFRTGTNGTNIVGSFTYIPQVPMTSGTNVSGTSYNGTFQLSPNTNASADANIGYPTGALNYAPYTNSVTNNLSVQITLNPTNANSILRYTVPATLPGPFTNGIGYTNVANGFKVSGIRLQSSASTNAFHIIATNDNLTNVVLCGTNNTRKIYFYKTGNATLNLTTTNVANASWYLGMTLSNTPLAITYNAGNTLTIIGGIRSNAPITKVGTGNWTISQDTSPGALEDVGDRIMWLEDYPTP